MSTRTTSGFLVPAFLYFYTKHVPSTHMLGFVFACPLCFLYYSLDHPTVLGDSLAPLGLCCSFHSGSVSYCVRLHTSVLLFRDVWVPLVFAAANYFPRTFPLSSGTRGAFLQSWTSGITSHRTDNPILFASNHSIPPSSVNVQNGQESCPASPTAWTECRCSGAQRGEQEKVEEEGAAGGRG